MQLLQTIPSRILDSKSIWFVYKDNGYVLGWSSHLNNYRVLR